MRNIRKDRFRLSQSAFAELTGVAQSTVSRWENGTPPSLDDLALIRTAARKLEIEWDDAWFFDLEEAAE